MSKRFAEPRRFWPLPVCCRSAECPSQAPVTEETIVAQASIGRPRKWCFLAYR